MIHEFGVRAGRITLNRMVELLSTNPAKLFGLYPRKGTIAVGSDADIVVFDPERKLTISAAEHHSKIDYKAVRGAGALRRGAQGRAGGRVRAEARLAKLEALVPMSPVADVPRSIAF
jgi:dihydroorotase-like cyclic amidohydrolase